MKFFKVFVERKQWAVVYIATNDNITENSVMNSSASVESSAKKQIDDQTIWTDASFQVDSVEPCDESEAHLCDFMP